MFFLKRENKKLKRILSLTINDLNVKQKRFAFRLLAHLLAGEITPFDFQNSMLRELGYKPKRKDELGQCLFVLVAENLSILFKIIGNEIVMDYDFKENPFPLIPDFENCHVPAFTRNFTIDTNITARQFADCLDYMHEFNKIETDENMPGDSKRTAQYRLHLLAKIAETLYKIDYESAKKIPFEILFAIQIWFASISMFFHKHSIYRVLFRHTDENAQEKISLGMSETILHLQKEGYTNVEEMNIIDFFNAQVKSLKDNLSHAKAEGAKIEEIARQTHLETDIINKLT